MWRVAMAGPAVVLRIAVVGRAGIAVLPVAIRADVVTMKQKLLRAVAVRRMARILVDRGLNALQRKEANQENDEPAANHRVEDNRAFRVSHRAEIAGDYLPALAQATSLALD